VSGRLTRHLTTRHVVALLVGVVAAVSGVGADPMPQSSVAEAADEPVAATFGTPTRYAAISPLRVLDTRSDLSKGGCRRAVHS